MGRGGGDEQGRGRVSLASTDSRVIRDLIEQASNRKKTARPLPDEVAAELESWIFNWSRILPREGQLFSSGRWLDQGSVSRSVLIRGDYSQNPDGEIAVEVDLDAEFASRQRRQIYRGRSLNSALEFYLQQLEDLGRDDYRPEETITADPYEIAAEIQYLIRTYIA
jgi:hypothetical protein